MAKPATDHPAQQSLFLIWESELVRSGDNRVQLVAKKPFSRMSTERAAQILGCSVWTINKLCRAGILKRSKPGAVAVRRDGRASNAASVLDAESVLSYHEECKQRA